MSLISPDGSVHILWQAYSGLNDRKIRYRKMLENGTMTDMKEISGNYSAVVVTGGLSAKISEDGKHLVVAFTGYRLSSYGRCNNDNIGDGCMEILFTESLDGGGNWTTPIKMNRDDMNDRRERIQPAIFLEDTGKVYLMYTLDPSFFISVRQPNTKDFEKEKNLTTTYELGPKYLGQSIEGSKKHMHLIWNPHISDYTIYHMRSSDDGQTWSAPKKLAEGEYTDPISSARVTKEGKVFLQYFKGIDIKIVLSKDHGNTLELPVRMGSDNGNNNAFDICGKGNEERIISFNVKRLFGGGYLRYMIPGSKDHHILEYPFHNFKDIDSVHLSCMHKEKQYTIFIILKEKNSNDIHFAYGMATDI